MRFTRRSLLGSLGAAGLAVPMRARAETEPATPALDIAPGRRRFGPDGAPEIDVVTLRGDWPAPVLRIKKGEPLRLALANGLVEPTALHWRGVRVPNAMEGSGLTGPPLAPGGQADIGFTPPDAGTFLYQAAGTAQAGTQQMRGLAGVLIVEEAQPPQVDADLVLATGDSPVPAQPQSGPAGAPPVLLNGVPLPGRIEAAPGARLRLRVVNLSSRLVLPVGFNGMKVLVIAIDGQPCDPFQPMRATVPMTPGARFDIICDRPADLAETAVVLRGPSDTPLAILKAKGDPLPARPVFTPLEANPALPVSIALEKASRADLTIAAAPAKTPDAPPGWTINGAAGSAAMKPALTVTRGTPISLGFINKSELMQPIHVHGHVMRQLHLLDDGWEPYWRDTVLVPPGKTVRVAFVADNPGRWMIESALPDWTAAGLWTFFEVT